MLEYIKMLQNLKFSVREELSNQVAKEHFFKILRYIIFQKIFKNQYFLKETLINDLQFQIERTKLIQNVKFSAQNANSNIILLLRIA